MFIEKDLAHKYKVSQYWFQTEPVPRHIENTKNKRYLKAPIQRTQNNLEGLQYIWSHHLNKIYCKSEYIPKKWGETYGQKIHMPAKSRFWKKTWPKDFTLNWI